MPRSIRHIVLGFCLLFVSGHAAWSETTTYTNEGDFMIACASLPGVQESISWGDGYGGFFAETYQPYWPVIFAGVTFQGRFLSLAPIPITPTSPRVYLNNYDSDTPLTLHFSSGARAFGAWFSSWLSPYHSNFTATVTTDNGDKFTFTAPADPDSKFFGFASTTSFTNLTFSDGGILGTEFPMHEELIADIHMVLNSIPAARLSIMTSPYYTNDLLLTWPAVNSGFYVEGNPDLTTTNWGGVWVRPQGGGRHWVVDISKPSGPMYYRLVHLRWW